MSARAPTAPGPRSRLPVLSVALAAFVVYAGTLGHALVWDDPALVARAAALVEDGGLGALLSAEFVLDPLSDEELGYYRPVVLLSLWSDSRWAGGGAFAYHATNVALHVATSLLVLALAGRLVATRRAAWLAALLFAIPMSMGCPVRGVRR